MPKPRKQQVSIDATPYYHCTSRCVRRAYLCGVDELTGQSYEHRRQWVEERLWRMAEVFAIDICAYAVMSNHLHVVLHVNREEAVNMDDQTVCQRWHKLYKGSLLTQRFLNNESLTTGERKAVKVKAKQWRENLYSISWFMRALNEPIARQANAEDGCTGKFWESRFDSQALLDEKALLSCMTYVDLNPVRAKEATAPENSKHTAIYWRIRQHTQTGCQPATLMPFKTGNNTNLPSLPFSWTDYCELVDWTGRAIREDKPGYIPQKLPPILERIAIKPRQWRIVATSFEHRFKSLAGALDKLRLAAPLLGYQRPPGVSTARWLFN